MQGQFLVVLLLAFALTEGLLFGSKSKCPIKKYKSSKYVAGEPLLLHENLHDRVKGLESLAKECKVHLYIKGSYYQLPYATQSVVYADADLVIGHGFRFELRDETNAVLCNKICLSNNPMSFPQAKCFLQGAINRGFSWSPYNTDVLSDGTYAANTNGYQTLKTDIQTKCKDEKLKRGVLRALRKMHDEKEKKK